MLWASPEATSVSAPVDVRRSNTIVDVSNAVVVDLLVLLNVSNVVVVL